MEIMVSVWAFTCPGSRSFDMIQKNNWWTTYVGAGEDDAAAVAAPLAAHLVAPLAAPLPAPLAPADEGGHRADGKRSDLPIETHGKGCRLVDPTTEAARKYVWSLIETGYYNYGIKIFWLDASEPEGFGKLATNASWAAGNMRDMVRWWLCCSCCSSLRRLQLPLC